MASITKTSTGYRVHVYVRGVRDSSSFRTLREANAWAAATEHKLRAEDQNRKEFLKKYGASKTSRIVSPEQLMKTRTPVYRGSGVYVLYDAETAVYVGKSNNVFSRVTEHMIKGRHFTDFAYIPCLPDEMSEIEDDLIRTLNPVGNSAGFLSGYRRRPSKSATAI